MQGRVHPRGVHPPSTFPCASFHGCHSSSRESAATFRLPEYHQHPSSSSGSGGTVAAVSGSLLLR
uniref:Uncharacterized protein n=1 Tax=Arundo donax TaxID=35708 RepID=A0A0A9EWG6_ARUDO